MEVWKECKNLESLSLQERLIIVAVYIDLVYGPVANDRVYAAFALYESELLDKEGLIKELKTYKLVDQMLFHTDKSLKYLKYIEVKEIIL